MEDTCERILVGVICPGRLLKANSNAYRYSFWSQKAAPSRASGVMISVDRSSAVESA